jgi:LDH2 family malate/lactate/ureidoglycolate dehydrogenase
VAAVVAAHLVNAEMSGHPSHGILRLSQYTDEVERGIIVAGANPVVTASGQNAFVVDAGFGFGHAAAATAADVAGDAAIASGVAVVTIRHCTHVGRLGEYAERLGARGLLSVVLVGAVGPGVGSMAAFGSGSGRPFFNTNPWAVGAPGADANAPVVFDAAMTMISEGKVHVAKHSGVSLPEGSILDAQGRPSRDPDDFYAGGTLTPLGGTSGGHKGYGLALTAALMGGLAHADGSAPALRGLARLREADGAAASIGGVTIIAIHPRAFGGDAYPGAVDRISAVLRADGALVPGDVERNARHRANGEVVLPAITAAQLAKLVDRFPATA